jgi:hypothetical protein
MVLAAAEWAAQVSSAGIARMREEPNPALFAMHGATGQFRTSAQNGVERDLILTNKRTSAIVLVPIPGKGKNLFDADDEKDRLSAMLRILLFMSSSYPLDAKATRGGRGFFSEFDAKSTKCAAQTQHPLTLIQPQLPARPTHLRCARHLEATTWKRKSDRCPSQT